MTLVDTNIVIDIVSNDSRWSEWAIATLQTRADAGPLLINDIIYAELASRFTSRAILDDTLQSMHLLFEQLTRNSLHAAGRAFARYRAAGGPRVSLLPDFLIGAQASVLGAAIVTRDVRRFRTYFPEIKLIAP